MSVYYAVDIWLSCRNVRRWSGSTFVREILFYFIFFFLQEKQGEKYLCQSVPIGGRDGIAVEGKIKKKPESGARLKKSPPLEVLLPPRPLCKRKSVVSKCIGLIKKRVTRVIDGSRDAS